MFFQLFSTLKVNRVAKITQSAYLWVIFHVKQPPPPSPCTTVGVWLCEYVRGLENHKPSLPNFVTKKPFGNYFRKYRTQFVWLYIFQNILCCFNFHLREAFKSPKNALDTLASWMKTETNTMTFLILNSFLILPLYVNVVTIISKDLNLIFYLFIFSKFNPLNQYYRNYQFLPFFNGENPLLVHGFH